MLDAVPKAKLFCRIVNVKHFDRGENNRRTIEEQNNRGTLCSFLHIAYTLYYHVLKKIVLVSTSVDCNYSIQFEMYILNNLKCWRGTPLASRIITKLLCLIEQAVEFIND